MAATVETAAAMANQTRKRLVAGTASIKLAMVTGTARAYPASDPFSASPTMSSSDEPARTDSRAEYRWTLPLRADAAIAATKGIEMTSRVAMWLALAKKPTASPRLV